MGLYSIITRADGTVLTGGGSASNIFNVDHLNHVTHTEPESINSYETDVPEMQLEVNPAPLGVLSLGVRMSDDLTRLRYALSTIKRALGGGGTSALHWYTPTTTFVGIETMAAASCRMERSTTISVTNTIFTWNVTTYDTTGAMASVNGPKAGATGNYIVGGTIAFGNGVTTGPQNDLIVLLLRNFTVIGAQNLYSLNPMPKSITVQTLAKFNRGDVLRMQVIQTDGVPQVPTINTTTRPAIWMALVGR